MLRVELLGPLRVSVDGGAVELPAGRLRALLAASPDDVDALRFGGLLDQAAGARNSEDERALLAEALGLWRGTPFDGIRSDWLEQSVAPALEERYLTALERHVHLDLAQGMQPDMARLGEAVERYPLRESLWVRLLRALEAAGRPAEALERYETVRRRLADELGVDPSPELRQVHADLLAGDVAPAVRTVPRQLPAAVDGFAGRETELAALDALLTPPDEAGSRAPLITLISGTAGVGKTTLAVHWAHRVAERFPDGHLYIDLRGYDPSGEAVSPAAAVREFLDALHTPPHRIPEAPTAQAALYRSVLAGRRMLILLDNARDAEQVAPLLPAAPGCLVVVTGRGHLTKLVMTYGARPLTLDLLPTDEARRFLARRLGHDRVAAEPAATEQIVRRCAGLPLALSIVAARAAIRPTHPLSALADELHDALGAMEDADIRAIFSWSYDTLTEEAARVFRLVAGLHPGPECTVAAAASLAGVPSSRVRAPLAELTRANLLNEYAPGRYSSHDLLKAYAAELCRAIDPDRGAAQRRLVGHYVHTAYAAARHVHGHTDIAAPASPRPGVQVTDFTGPDEALAWFTVERPALLAALGLALDREVCDLAQAMFVVLHRHGRTTTATSSTASKAGRTTP